MPWYGRPLRTRRQRSKLEAAKAVGRAASFPSRQLPVGPGAMRVHSGACRPWPMAMQMQVHCACEVRLHWSCGCAARGGAETDVQRSACRAREHEECRRRVQVHA